MAQNDNAISVLEKLVETCRDGQNGYRDAAEATHNAELKQFFNEQSLERGQFAGELENEIQRLGKPDPDRKGSVSGAIHRKWFDLKQSLGGGDESILSSVEAGEDNAKKNYNDAVNSKDIPSDVREVIARQAERVNLAHNRARDLRDRFKNAA
jgi:uncharacterized protein (TIGR02284 family)